MKVTARFNKIAALVIVLCVAVFCRWRQSSPSGEPQLVCGRALTGALAQWELEAKAVAYPNVEGSSKYSLAPLDAYFGRTNNVFADYAYVPGLSSKDPSNLILFYVTSPVHRRYHGEKAKRGNSGKWLTFNPAFHSMTGVEFEELLDKAEFKSRLKATIGFLEKNQRPHWTNAVAEHRKFLETL